MSDRAGTLRSRLLGDNRPTERRMIEALESRLEDGEQLAYQLTSGGSLTHEQDGDTYEKGGGDGGTLFAATDRKLVFVVDTRTGLETADVPYTDLKDVTTDSGILSTSLSVTVWGRGTFSFDPDGGDDPARVAEFAARGSTAWQRVVAALQDARQHISTIPTYVGDGDMGAAAEARSSARDHLSTAAGRIEEAPGTFQSPLRQRHERVETELAKARMDARADRGGALLERASTRLEGGGPVDCDEVYATLDRARDHLEAALLLAIEEGFSRAEEIQATLSDLHGRLRTLEARPLELAERARERAQAAGDPEAAVPAWEEALAHYRDALTAAWGTDADFDGDDAALRMQIEWVVANAVTGRRAIAERLEGEGDDHRDAGDPDRARDCYEAAADQLAMARRLAREHRAGDAEAISAHLDRLRATCESLPA